jgi:hypothetical protein
MGSAALRAALTVTVQSIGAGRPHRGPLGPASSSSCPTTIIGVDAITRRPSIPSGCTTVIRPRACRGVRRDSEHVCSARTHQLPEPACARAQASGSVRSAGSAANSNYRPPNAAHCCRLPRAVAACALHGIAPASPAHTADHSAPHGTAARHAPHRARSNRTRSRRAAQCEQALESCRRPVRARASVRAGTLEAERTAQRSCVRIGSLQSPGLLELARPRTGSASNGGRPDLGRAPSTLASRTGRAGPIAGLGSG